MIYRLKLILYQILTLLIELLGFMREKLQIANLILKHRTFLTERVWIEGYGSLEICCDCGLAHRTFLREKGLFKQPLRPKQFSYRFRITKSSPLYQGVSE